MRTSRIHVLLFPASPFADASLRGENGDGKTDFIFSSAATAFVMLSKGDGTFTATTFSYSSPVVTVLQALYTPVVGDFNGDGKADYALVMATGTLFFLGNGDGSFSQTQYIYPNSRNFGAPPSAAYTQIIGDFNGDGKIDFGFATLATFFTLQAASSPPNCAPQVSFQADGRTVNNSVGSACQTIR